MKKYILIGLAVILFSCKEIKKANNVIVGEQRYGNQSFYVLYYDEYNEPFGFYAPIWTHKIGDTVIVNNPKFLSK